MEKARFCPICSRTIAETPEGLRFRPFCSRRCADIDLGRWLKGSYAIPAPEQPGETDTDDGQERPADEGPNPVRR